MAPSTKISVLTPAPQFDGVVDSDELGAEGPEFTKGAYSETSGHAARSPAASHYAASSGVRGALEHFAQLEKHRGKVY